MISEEALAYAIERIESFALVQAHREDRMEPLNVLFNSVGLDSIKDPLLEWIDSRFPTQEDESIILGVLLGLFILQFYCDEYGIDTTPEL